MRHTVVTKTGSKLVISAAMAESVAQSVFDHKCQWNWLLRVSPRLHVPKPDPVRTVILCQNTFANRWPCTSEKGQLLRSSSRTA